EHLGMCLVDRDDEWMLFGDLGPRSGDVDLRVDLMVGKAFTEPPGEVAERCARFGHWHRRRDAEVYEEVGPVRRPRNAPGIAPADRADVDDPLLPPVRRSLL